MQTQQTSQKTKEELLQIISDCSQNSSNEYDILSYSKLTSRDLYLDEESFCTEDEDFLENDEYRVEVESMRGAEGDGAEMFLTVKITDKSDKEEYFIEFFGRYSSWDSASYHRSYIVEPYQEMVTFYREIK